MPESCTQEAYKIEIVKRSNLLEISQPGDEVMADKGFLIKDELASVGAALVLPKFLQGKTNSTRKKLHKTRKLQVHGFMWEGAWSELRTSISWTGNLPSNRLHWLQTLLLFYLHSPIFYPLECLNLFILSKYLIQ